MTYNMPKLERRVRLVLILFCIVAVIIEYSKQSTTRSIIASLMLIIGLYIFLFIGITKIELLSNKLIIYSGILLVKKEIEFNRIVEVAEDGIIYDISKKVYIDFGAFIDGNTAYRQIYDIVKKNIKHIL